MTGEQLNALSRYVLDAAYAVHNEIGPGGTTQHSIHERSSAAFAFNLGVLSRSFLMTIELPSLYAILDVETCNRRAFDLFAVAVVWRDAGVRLVQYRDKQGSDAAVLSNALKIKSIFEGTDALLILNDRVHLFAASGFHGVHVGQTDAGIAKARELIGPGAILGMSTHSPLQVADADGADIDYVAIGPVYGTQTKLDAAPVVGLDGVRVARSLTRKPLVAIGGITRGTVASIRGAGADSVALISALLPTGNPPDSLLVETAQDFLAPFK